MKFKPIFTISAHEKKVRLFRILYAGSIGGYSKFLSFGLNAKLIDWNSGWREWRVTFLGLQLHYRHSVGGLFPA